MPQELAPPVAAVMVVGGPAAFLEEALAAIAAQDYPNLRVVVLDLTGSDALADKVRASIPGAEVRLSAGTGSYGAAVNDALGRLEGATHVVICHDDVAMAPDAVRRLVEHAYSANAAVVGPKIVSRDFPDRLVEVGLGMDRFGRSVSRVERTELDQGQHDVEREVFAVSSSCALVRSDLFEALGGLDEELGWASAFPDLCWRAQVAGARVVIAPAAIVRLSGAGWSGTAREAGGAAPAGTVPDDESAAVALRDSMRSVLKNYDVTRRAMVVGQMALSQLVASLGEGGRRDLRRWRGALEWNLRRGESLRSARRVVRHSRQRPDKAVAGLFTRGGWRSSGGAFAKSSLEGRSAPLRTTPEALATGVVVVVVLFGLRNLVFGRLPVVGQLLVFGSPGHLLSQFFGGWNDAGWQRTGPAPTGFGLVGVVGTLLFDSTAQVVKVMVLAPALVGPVGIYRLLKPFGSRRAGVAGAIAYLGFPLMWNAIAAGDLQALAAYALMPYIALRLARASRLEPFDQSLASRGWRAVAGEIAPLALVLLVCFALAPPIAIAAALLLVGIAAGSVVAGGIAGAARAVLIGLSAAAVAFGCSLPWSLTFVQAGARWSILSGAVSAPGLRGGVAAMLRLGVGPVGAGWIGWGLVVAASFVLLAGHGPRLAWAARWWTVALGAAFVAFAGSAGWLGAGGGATLVLLAPVACGLSAAVGTGVVAFEQDLAQRRFGWRQSAGVVALAVFAAGLLPVLVSSAGGRSLLPVAGYEQVASFTPASQGSYKVLWLGDPVALPGPGWQLERGLAYSVSSGPLPDGTRLWPSPNPGTGSEVAVALKGATDGVTVRLGAALASAGIRYVVVPESVGPVLPGEQTPPRAPVPPGLVTALVSESDMRELPTEGGVLVFESTASRPVIAGASTKAGTGVRAAWRELGVATGLFVTALCIAEGVVRRRSRRKLAS